MADHNQLPPNAGAGSDQLPSNAGAGSDQLPPNAVAGSNQVPSNPGAGSNQVPFITGDQSPLNGYHYSPFNTPSSRSTFPSGSRQSPNSSFPSGSGGPYYTPYYPFSPGDSSPNGYSGNNPSPSPAETGYYSSGYPQMASSRNFSARNHHPLSRGYINSGVPPAGNPLPPSDAYYGFLNREYLQPESTNPLEWEFNQLRLSPIRNLQRSRAQSAARAHSSGLTRTSSRSPDSGRPLSDFRGRILSAAKNQHASRFLQSKFGNPDDVQMIFSEVVDHVCELMLQQFGNQFIQKFLAVVNEEQMNHLLCSLVNDEMKFLDTCTDMHGTRGVQKLLEHLTTPQQRSLVVSVLRRLALPLIKDQNGQHVIQHCLKYFPREDNKYILYIVADNCLEVATDQSGCCVIQQCLAHSVGEPANRLMSAIVSNALILSEHPYGNYVVQYVLGFKIRNVTREILMQLSGNFVSLSLNKYGSNVVEQCMRQSTSDQALIVINELMRSPNILRIFRDPFGNYVAQCAIEISEKDVLVKLLRLVEVNEQFLHSHPYGKRVLDVARMRGFRFARTLQRPRD